VGGPGTTGEIGPAVAPPSPVPVDAAETTARPVQQRQGGAGSAPRPSAPGVQQLVVRYAKRGKMRFASQLDVARAFERGVRRAGLPIAYSSGFTPHPKISYADGVPTGVASEAEYLSLGMTSPVEPADAGKRLNAALPDGIDVIAVTAETGGLPASRLTASEWQVLLPDTTTDNVVPVVQKFLALEHAPVERLTAKGMRRMDARSAVVTLDARPGTQGGTELRMVVRHTVPAVRPGDVLTALRQVSDAIPAAQPLMTRLAQGSLGESGVVEP
jgi:radical SAM-linked protein